MIVAFKNKQNSPTDLANKLIGFWTGSPWVHCEMLLQTPNQLAVSSRTHNDGVTVATWKDILEYPDLWEYYQVPVTSDDAVWNFLVDQSGKHFNYSGLVAGQVFKTPINQLDGWFCSELTYSTILQFGLIALPSRNPTTVSPALLRKYLQDAQCPQISIYQFIN